MFGLSFTDAAAAERTHPARADVALFVGWTTRRAGAAVPRALAEWLRERRYPAGALLDTPVPVDSWAVFDALFDWHARPVSAGGTEAADDYLGLAVRDFFANGGRKCYVVRLEAPWSVLTEFDEASREAQWRRLLPLAGVSGWQNEHLHGVEHAWALDDVSLVLVPDLPDLCASRRGSIAPEPAVVPGQPEVFVECGVNLVGDAAVAGVRRVSAPRLDDEAWTLWKQYAEALRARMAQRRRDLMLLLALPLAAPRAGAARDPVATLNQEPPLRSSMLQLATPWLRPTREQRVAEGLLPPDGALAGLVAARVLARGAAATAAGQAPLGVLGVTPAPSDELLRRFADSDDQRDTLLTRCALFGSTPDGVRLLSDRSTSRRSGWSHAGVVRLLGQLLRTARRVGETLVFEPSGEALWTATRSRFEDMLTRFWQAGALRGASAAEAFSVRCDRTVMSQADIDNGRVVVLIDFMPQLAIARLRVALALAEDGGVQWTDADPVAELTP